MVRSHGLFGILFFLWMALLTFLSLVSMDNIGVKGPEIPYLDKVLHFSFYLIAMLLGSLFARERSSSFSGKMAALVRIGLLLVLYGMIIEVLQGTGSNERSAEWGDLAANILGIAAGGWISLLAFRKVRALNWPD